jgi:sugar phosphate isomerase/epimerase
MKLGFSSLSCPTWSLETILSKAKEYGYTGVEMRGLQGELDLTRARPLSAEPDKVRARLADAGIQLVCLGSNASFASKSAPQRQENEDQVRRYIDLAARLDCPLVRVFSGDVPPGTNRHTVQALAAEHLRHLAPYAAQQNVTVIVENVGDFSRSKDLWYFADATSHPNVACCWNVVNGMTAGERPTISIPRLGSRIRLVHLSDAKFDEQFRLTDYVPPGSGQVEFERLVTLLRGVAYTGFIMFEWPRLWLPELPDADAVLPQFKKLLQGFIDEKQPPLTAYKGDKNAPRLAKLAD